MELAPLFLLLLLPPADATGEMANALQASLRSELGDVSMALAPDRLVTPAMLEGPNPTYRARFVAHVTWSGKDKASIEVQSGREAQTATPYRASRVVSFSSRDRKAERGRAIGLVLAGLLRDSPPAVLGTAPASPAVAPEPAPKGLALAALLTVQRAKSGTWPVGPVFSFSAPFTDALGLQVSAGLLASDDYWELPLAVEGRWRFLRSHDNRRALALGLGAVVLRESTSLNSHEDNGGNASLWNLAGVASLSGHLALGRSLRVLAQAELQALARAMTLHYGEEHLRTMTFSRWRPAFGLGLGYAF
jgi:hypothetical protein